MPEEKTEKVVIISTHGGDDPERASLPFVMGNASLVMDVETTIALQGNAVTTVMKGTYEHIFAGGLDPLKKLVDTFLELGGKVLVCAPCIKERQITTDMLIDGVKIMAGATLIQACVDADAVLNY